MHDRLGSVRLLIDDTGTVKKSYTFDPFGNLLESYDDGGNIENSYLFTGQFFDNEINQYYLRARQYDPELQRFTSIDPVRGGFTEPLTLHQYLYCVNDPVNRWYPTGEMSMLEPVITSALNLGKKVFNFASTNWAKYKMTKRLKHVMTMYNAHWSGIMNMYSGPDSVNKAALYFNGFVAGVIENVLDDYLDKLKPSMFTNPAKIKATSFLSDNSHWLAAAAGGAYLGASNYALQNEDEGSILQIGLDAAIGAIATAGGQAMLKQLPTSKGMDEFFMGALMGGKTLIMNGVNAWSSAWTKDW